MKSTDTTIKGSTLLVQTQMILVLVCFRQFDPSKTVSTSTDGLTVEFYLSFRELLGQELVDSFNYAFEKGEMLISQKRGIITLIPKKDKNRTLLDNWRPISLLNTDYSQSQLELRKCYPAQNY